MHDRKLNISKSASTGHVLYFELNIEFLGLLVIRPTLNLYAKPFLSFRVYNDNTIDDGGTD